ncbi:MAG TPA: PAC2 family protein [Actinomycetota bacterium]|nr:PAC2 family protein [Actinomycetota bacterium]
MGLLRLEGDVGPLVAPALVAAFDGWIDAAGASTAATGLIASGGETLATFDSDAIYDYRSRRPVLDIVDGTLTELAWPDLTITHRSIGGRDLLLLTGPEPDLRWQELGRDLLELGLRLGVVEWVSLGSIPAAVPHTRPVPILATASKPGLLRADEQQGPPGLLRVPAAALSTVELEVTGAGVPTVGFYAQVPHYVGSPFHAATIAILEHAGRHLGVEFPLGSLPDDAAAQRQRLDAAIAQDEDLRAYVDRLETAMGEEGIPSGDELAQEIERYLRGQGGDGPSRIGD